MWTKALSLGVCPYDACDLTKATCGHLDRYLSYVDNPNFNYRGQVTSKKTNEKVKVPRKEIRLLYTDDIDDFAKEPPARKRSAWELFKKLRKVPLERDQIGILIRRFHYGMSYRQIQTDMGWTSVSVLYRRYKEALETVRKRGAKNGR